MTDGLRPRRRTGLWVALAAVGAVVVGVAYLRPDQLLQRRADPPPVAAMPPIHRAVDVPALAAPPDPVEVTLQLQSHPPGASVWLNGSATPRGRTPLRLVVPKGGAVQATLKADGYVDRELPWTRTAIRRLRSG